MHATRKVKLKDLSPNLTCRLCGGYFIDATTIIECLHSFCRSCIVQHLEKSEYCPVCEVQLHSSKPLTSIRPDQMLQEIVYKLVPGLFQNEMSQRRQYYKSHSEVKPKSQQDGGQVFNESYITSDDIIHISLEFDTTDKKLRESTKRYFQCPAAVSIAILKKLVQGKYDLRNTSCIEITYRERYLPDEFLLMDIAYKYSWSQNGSPLQLYYRVRDSEWAKTTFKPEPIIFRQKPKRMIQTAIRQRIISNDEKVISSKKGLKIEKPIIKLPGKPRGRPKRTISTGEDDTVVKMKKSKITKIEKTSKKKSKITKIGRDRIYTEETSNQSIGTEVQLRISENGVISAKRLSSGEEKIINPILPCLNSPMTSISSNNEIYSPSPIGFLKKFPTTNGNHHPKIKNQFEMKNPLESSPSPKKPKLMDNNSKYSTESESIENNEKVRSSSLKPEIKSTDSNLWRDEEEEFVDIGINSNKFNKNPLPTTTTTTTTLKIPTPTKWLQQPKVMNGSLKFTTKSSPVKDRLGFSTVTTPSSSKKPPKFFKSRMTESNNGNSSSGSNENSNLIQNNSDVSESCESNKKKLIGTTTTNTNQSSTNDNNFNMTDLKNPILWKSIPTLPSAAGSYENGSNERLISQNFERKRTESTTLVHPDPISTPSQIHHHQQQLNHHHQYSSYTGHLLDDNLNMNSMGLSPMHFVPSLGNGYCSLPFFTNPCGNPTINPFLASALAMTMNMNPTYSPFSFTNTTNVGNSSNIGTNYTNSGSTTTKPQKHYHSTTPTKNNNTSLDLSMPSKKSKQFSSYVQISPKKMSQKNINSNKKNNENTKESSIRLPPPSPSSSSLSTLSPLPVTTPITNKNNSLQDISPVSKSVSVSVSVSDLSTKRKSQSPKKIIIENNLSKLLISENMTTVVDAQVPSKIPEEILDTRSNFENKSQVLLNSKNQEQRNENSNEINFTVVNGGQSHSQAQTQSQSQSQAQTQTQSLIRLVENSNNVENEQKMTTIQCQLESNNDSNSNPGDENKKMKNFLKNNTNGQSSPTSTVMATLMVSLDESTEVSPSLGVGKSPNSTINNNNNNILNEPSDTSAIVSSSIPVSLINSSTTTTTSA